MRAHQQQQETESEFCAGQEVMGASEAGGMEHEQLYGNQAAIERLCFEPIDIDVIDRDGTFATEWTALVTGEDTQVDVEHGVKEMVDEVIARAGARPIRRLTITSHGKAGNFNLGSNRVQPMAAPYLMEPFRALGPLFDEAGFVVLNSCRVADGEAGEQLLRRMHELLGVPIIAGTQPQVATTSGLDGTTLTMTEDEHGEPILEREEHPVADVLLDMGGTVSEWARAGISSGEEAAAGLFEAGSELLSTIDLPEVGDLEQWLFGA